MNQYLDVRDGTHDTPKYVDKGIPLVTSKNLKNGTIDFSTAKFISKNDHEQISRRSGVDHNDILFAMIGTIGNPVIISKDRDFSIKNVGLFKPWIKNTNMEYIFYYLLFIQEEMKKSASGSVQSFVSLTILRNYYIPIPPLNEQKRIVNILNLVDKYVDTDERFNKLNDKFSFELKELVLQRAIKGELVEQNPNDEPASVLLDKIREEKEQLIKDKKIKRNKNKSFIYRENNHFYEKIGKKEPVCIDEDLPFKIPESWEWCRLSTIVKILGDGLHGTPKYDENGEYYFINGNNLNDGKIIIKENTKKVNKEEYEKHKRILTKTTVLVSINGTIGNVAFFNNEKVMLGKSACYFNLFEDISKYYIKLLIETDYFLKYALNSATGTTIKNVSLKAMKNLLIPLPPIKEQKRIVFKIDKLLNKLN